MGGSSTYILDCKTNSEAYELANKIIKNCVKDPNEKRISFFSKNSKNIVPFKKKFQKIYDLKIHGTISYDNWKKLINFNTISTSNKLLIYPKEKSKEKYSWSISMRDEGYSIILQFPYTWQIREELRKFLLDLKSKSIIKFEKDEIESILDKCVVNDSAIDKEFETNNFKIKSFIFDHRADVATGYGIDQKSDKKSLFSAFDSIIELFDLKNELFELDTQLDFESAIQIMDSKLFDDIYIWLVTSLSDQDISKIVESDKINLDIKISWPETNWIKSEGSTSYSDVEIDISKKQLIVSINYHRDVEAVLKDIEELTGKKFKYSDELS